jgi:diguanylate cyclase (GGDEF)-like protein
LSAENGGFAAAHQRRISVLQALARRQPTFRDLRVAFTVAAAYFVADIVLNKIALGDGWQIFWPLNGVTIALLVMRSRREWPLWLASIAIGTGLGEFLDDNPLTSTLIQRALSLLEVISSALILPRFSTLSSWLRVPGLYRRFAAAVVVGPAISGIFAATYFHWAEGRGLLESFNAWALADGLGVAAVLPLVLAVCSPETRAMSGAGAWLRCIGTLVAAVSLIAAVFITSRYPLIFILYPLLMLVDWMLGLLGSAFALSAACVLAVFLTEHGYGPFAHATDLGMSVELAVQLYLGFHLLGFLPISILFLEQRRMDRELRDTLAHTAALASLDGLTGVANRRTLDAHLAEHWKAGAHNRTSLALLMIDADHFKEFNDRFGHQAGDECLRRVATALTQHVSRPSDLVARFGGEEFAVLLPNTPLEGARVVAERLCSAIVDLAIAHHTDASGQPRCVTVSIGCAAMVPDVTTSFCHLIESSDRALYLAKHSGRNRVCVDDCESGVWHPGTAGRKLRARIDALIHKPPKAHPPLAK